MLGIESCSPEQREVWVDVTMLLLNNGARVSRDTVTSAAKLLSLGVNTRGSLSIMEAGKLLLGALRRCKAKGKKLEVGLLSELIVEKKDPESNREAFPEWA